MIDYKAMYFTLFNSMTDAIHTLQAAQNEAERLYADSEDEPKLTLLHPPEQ